MAQQMIPAYPLTWPIGKPRTKWCQRSQFRTTLGKAIEAVRHEVRLLGGRELIISSNLQLRLDGIPYASQRQPEDAGVAVYFNYKGKPMCFACDRWYRVEDNMWATAKTIEALRGIERWGTGSMVEQAFTGFQALPPPVEGVRPWWEVLGFKDNESVTLKKAEQVYRELSKKLHPDLGGDAQGFSELADAIRKARQTL